MKSETVTVFKSSGQSFVKDVDLPFSKLSFLNRENDIRVKSVRCIIFKNQFRLYKYQFCISFLIFCPTYLWYISKKKSFSISKIPQSLPYFAFTKNIDENMSYIFIIPRIYLTFFFSFQLIHSFYDKQNSYSVVFTTFFVKGSHIHKFWRE